MTIFYYAIMLRITTYLKLTSLPINDIFNSTETALIKVQDDTLLAIDDNSCMMLLLLNLSAAFDKVDHQIPLHRLFYLFGIVTKMYIQWSCMQGRLQPPSKR